MTDADTDADTDAEGEARLLAGLQGGDERAFRQLVETYKDRVYNTCLGFVGRPEEAEDVAQEVFVAVYRAVGSFRGESRLSTWIYRIAVTQALQHRRARARRQRAIEAGARLGLGRFLPTPERADFAHPGLALENKEQAGVLAAAVESLPDNQRIAFTLHKVEGMSYREVAEVMDTSLAAVESLMHRARGNLRRRLERYYRRG